MSYQKYKWEVIARDYNSPYLRNYLWTKSFFKYPKLLDVPRPVLGITSKNNQIEYIADLSTWIKAHEALKAKVMADFKNFENMIDKSIEWGEEMNAWTEKNIFDADLQKLSGAQLAALFKKFVDMQEDEYVYGTVLPVLDFMGFSFVERNLNRILQEKVGEEKIKEYYSVFTEPAGVSFLQEQEESLLNLVSKYWDNADWKQSIAHGDFEQLCDKYPEFSADLSRHTQKYAWVYYVFMGPAFTEKNFYSFIVDYINKGVEPLKKLEELKHKRQAVEATKNKFLQELDVNGLDEFICRIAGKVVWAKPRRKDFQSKSYYHVEKLCAEIGTRLSLSLDQVRSLPFDLMQKALEGETVDLSLTEKVKAFHICLPNDDASVSTLLGAEAEAFSRSNIIRSSEGQDAGQEQELKGSTACVGKARGKAKIINVPEDMEKMEQGDILVSSATTPSIIVAMKKAAAIVTDEGGLTCHAAIVSRELNIPCVVGLKTVTTFVKDGDMVEVDASKGIIRRLA